MIGWQGQWWTHKKEVGTTWIQVMVVDKKADTSDCDGEPPTELLPPYIPQRGCARQALQMSQEIR